MSDPPPRRYIAIPQGRFVLDAGADRMIRATSGGLPGDGVTAHPVFAFVAALGGLGLRIGEVFAMAGGAIERGPLLASCALHIHRPMKVGLTYDVAGELRDVRRKASRRFGAADHFHLHIALASGGIDYAALDLRVIVPAGREEDAP